MKIKVIYLGVINMGFFKKKKKEVIEEKVVPQESMDCSKCIKTCKANCCGPIPFPKEFFEKHKPVREILQKIEQDGLIIAICKENYCTFLGEDFKCSIYEDRLFICNKFGDAEHPFSTCIYQDKDGRIRSRQEKRKLQRKIGKEVDKRINKK